MRIAKTKMKAAIRRTIKKCINSPLRLFGLQIVYKPSWDKHFSEWAKKAEREGRDPNDVGDEAWPVDPLKRAMDAYYLPHVSPSSTVLELGPGTGRLTRHLISRCKHIILTDNSPLVCRFLDSYLRGKGSYEIHHIERPELPVPDNAVDFAVANGVFEHLDPEETLYFLREFYRVLAPGAWAALGFNNILKPAAMEAIDQWSKPGIRCIFRFYAPAAMERLAEAAGFSNIRLSIDEHRLLSYIEMQK